MRFFTIYNLFGFCALINILYYGYVVFLGLVLTDSNK